MLTPSKEIVWLARRVRPFIGRYAVSIAFLTGASLLSLIDPLVMKWLLDVAIPSRRMQFVCAAAGVLFLSHAGRLFFSAVATLATFSAIQKMTLRIRQELLRHLNELPFDYHERTPVGERLFRVERDVDQIGEAGGDFLPTCLRMAFTATFTLIAMLWLNPRLTCTVIPLNLLFFFLRRRFKGRLQTASDRVQSESSAASSFLQEHLSGIVQLQLLRRERSQMRVIMSAGVRKLRAQVRRKVDEMIFSSTSMVTVGFGAATLLTFGSYEIFRGALTIGGLVAAYGYLSRLFDPLNNAVELYARFNRLGASLRRVIEVLETPPVIRDAPDAVDLAVPARGAIRFDRAMFSYSRDCRLFDGLELDLRPGEKIALIGPSGSGKSTLTRLIARLHDVSDGSVHIDGIDVRKIRRSSLRSRLCYVPQEPVLFDRSLKENLLLGNPGATRSQLLDAIEAARLDLVVEKLPQGWDSLLGPRASRLSGGERQRLAIARAVLQRPDLMILDEATSALDIPTEREIFQNLRARFSECTILFVSHRVPALFWVDRILVLEGGRLVEQGNHSALLRRNGIYARLWATPVKDAPAARVRV